MKQKWILVGIVVLLLLIGIGGSYLATHRQLSERTAVITQNGEEQYRIDLNAVEEPYTITIAGEDGAWNQISISSDGVQMTDASCPDQLCVKQGKIADSFLPIVCLPNQVQIQIIASEETEELDAKVY